jgi:hypothetical protein
VTGDLEAERLQTTELLLGVKQVGSSVGEEVVSEPPSQTLKTNEGAPQFQKCFMDVRPPLVAYAQPPTVGKPGQRPLHHPAVPTQPLARIDASPGYARLYAPLPERLSAAREIVALIGMDLIRPPSW